MPAVCHPTRQATACKARIAAVIAGRFLMSFKRGGWLWLDATHPQQPWTRCPWCDGELPTPQTVYERIRHSLHEREEV